MNDISIHRTRTQFAAATASMRRAVEFKAWRSNAPVEDCPALATAQTFEEALAAVLDGCKPRTALYILRDDAGRDEKTLRIYRIKASTKRCYYRAAYDGGRAVRVSLPDATLVDELPVEAFEPVRPFDAFRDDASGRDLSLVESR